MKEKFNITGRRLKLQYMENKTNSLEFILFSVGEFLEFQDRIQEKFQTTFMKEFQRRQWPRVSLRY